MTFVTETLRGRLIDLDGQVFHFESDQGERIVFTLHEGSRIQPHHLEGIVRSPVRIEVTIEGAHDHATATRVDPCEQFHPEHSLPGVSDDRRSEIGWWNGSRATSGPRRRTASRPGP